jgi:DUF4097 and DUF4098 domain-containing protein YvlB
MMRGMSVFLVAVALLATMGSAVADEVRGKIEEESDGWLETIDTVIDVKPGGTLRLDSDRGGIEVDSEDRKGVRVIVEKKVDSYTEEEARRVLQHYTVDISTSGEDVDVTTESDNGRRTRSLEVSLRVIVPTRYNVDVQTGGGGIEIADLEGNVKARTSGGGIEVGHIRNGSVQVRTAGGGIDIAGIEHGNGDAETSGGGITVGDVTGDLTVRTAGGGIEVGAVRGNLEAHTSGGGIEIGQGQGTVNAQTGGGGIRVDGSGGAIVVRTSGGGIEIEEAGGPVIAETSGGSIKLRGAAGPVEVRTSGGGIALTDIHGSIEAHTAGGGISADLAISDPDVDTHCTLETAGGDITISLPADLKATVDAELRLSSARRKYRITSDFPLDIDDSSRRIVAQGKLNGGGDLIRLRTTNGDIKIKQR